MALAAFAPLLITPLLMIGGAYLAFEATEKIVEVVLHDHHDARSCSRRTPPQELEDRQVAGAIRTDFILSAEIMAIALNELGDLLSASRPRPWRWSDIVITVAVYGVVGLIVKLDDIGLHLAERRNAAVQALGRGLVHVVPKLLTRCRASARRRCCGSAAAYCCTVWRIWALKACPHSIHDIAEDIGEYFGPLGADHGLAGQCHCRVDPRLIIGGIIVIIVRQLHQASREICGRRLMHWLLVFLGGGLGAAARHGVNRATSHAFGPDFPWWTMAVNVAGSFAHRPVGRSIRPVGKPASRPGFSWSPVSSAASPHFPPSALMRLPCGSATALAGRDFTSWAASSFPSPRSSPD